MYRILIVDDEKMIRMGIQKAIDWPSLQIDEVYTAASAREAMACLKEHDIDVMITDISMTEMTGLELVAKLRAEETKLRIIVLTGFDKFDYARTALQLHVNDFLLKPVDEKELTESIRKQIKAIEEQKVEESNQLQSNFLQALRKQNELIQCMQELLLGKKLDEAKTQFLFGQMGYQAEQKMQIGILLPDLRFDKKEDNKQFEQYTIKNICMDLVDEQHKGITFQDHKEQILIAFFETTEGEGVEEMAKQLLDILGDELSSMPKLVLGSLVEGFWNLHISYNDAMYAMENENQPFEDIIRNRKDRERENIFLDVFQQFKMNMVDQMADLDKVLHIFDRFETAVRSYHLSVRDTRRCCFEIASVLAFSYNEESGNPISEGLNAFGDALGCTDREKACELTRDFLQKILQNDEGEEHELVAKVKKKINENLAEDLTVATLAEELYVTPNYLSRLFKRIVGEGCNEYMVRKRILKAKALLETTTLKVGEIATMVGYHDMNYFSLAFKKHTGMSPLKYREAAQNRSEN